MKTNKDPLLLIMGGNMRKNRRNIKLTQFDFAKKLGLHKNYYAGVERGERNVSALNLMIIAKGLQVEVGDLFPSLAQLNDYKKTREQTGIDPASVKFRSFGVIALASLFSQIELD